MSGLIGFSLSGLMPVELLASFVPEGRPACEVPVSSCPASPLEAISSPLRVPGWCDGPVNSVRRSSYCLLLGQGYLHLTLLLKQREWFEVEVRPVQAPPCPRNIVGVQAGGAGDRAAL